jgi:hypothetical protein
MSWPFRRRDPSRGPRLPHAYPVAPAATDRDADLEGLALLAFTCTTCGRSDLPEAGHWDPPICVECDAAINFDALAEELDPDAG